MILKLWGFSNSAKILQNRRSEITESIISNNLRKDLLMLILSRSDSCVLAKILFTNLSW